MAPVTLNLLGPFAIGSPAGPLNPGRKHRALLVHVACGPESGVSRPSLAALLWPDRDEESARNSLRQSVHQIRILLGDHDSVQVHGDRLALSRPHWDVDVWNFERLAAAGGLGDLIAAANSYRGQLGEGLDAGPDWDGWLAGQRERLRNAAQWVLQRVAQSDLTAFQAEIAIAFARRLLADDMLHEGNWRALMQLLDRAGLRAKALHAWNECRKVLRAELDVSPCAQTREVFERIRAADVTGATVPAVPRAMSALRTIDAGANDHLLCGLHFMYLGSPEDNLRARRAFDAAAMAAPECADALTLRGWTHFLDFLYGWNGDPDDAFRSARADCDAVLAPFPDHAHAHALKGKLLLWQSKFDAAMAEYGLALALTPASPYVLSNVADANVRIGNCGEALRLVARALELEPNDKGVFRTVEGFARFHIGDLEGSRTAFQSAITRHPLYCVAHSGMAAVCAELGEAERARESAARARMNNARHSVDFAMNIMPMRDPAQRERIARAWRAAGMPEHESG